MLNASGAVEHFKMAMGEPSGVRAADIRVRGCGTLAVYCSQAPMQATVDGAVVDFKYSTERCLLSVELLKSKELLTEVSLTF